MTRIEFLILFLYVLIVWYVYQSVMQEIAQLTEIKVSNAQIEAQLADLGLADVLSIKFEFTKAPLKEEMKTFGVVVENKKVGEGDRLLYVNWQFCTLRTFGGDIFRLFRLPQGENLNMLQSQAMSIINPGETLKEKITLESCITFSQETGFVVAKPVFAISDMKKARDNKSQFVINLFFQQPERPEIKEPIKYYSVACACSVEQLPWQTAIYWRPKKKKKK
ncbi:MAG: hypothetical protein WBB82_14380 [Limnothrix sp.]